MRTRLAVTFSLAGIALAVAVALLLRRPSEPANALSPSSHVSGKSTANLNSLSPDSPAQTTTVSSTAQLSAPSPSSPTRSFVRPPGLLGGGQPVRLSDIPPGTPLRETLDRLPLDILVHALARLSRLTFNILDAQSFRADSTGVIFSVCAGPRPHARLHASDAPPTVVAAESPLIAAASVPISAVPIRHSKPGASRVIYLDFNGHVVSGTRWNTDNSVASYDCVPYDLDGDLTTFNDEEQIRMLRIWARVSEDYAPFEVDVTTEEPAAFTRYTARALLTRSTDRNGVALPSSGSGGVAYVDVFGQSNYASYSPVFAYYDNLAVGFPGSGAYASEAIAHELGHNLGLSHDGTSTDNYYDGHGSGETSWAPIMGGSYGKSITQWSKGDYYDASNTEDDFAIMAAKLGYRTDDTGNTTATARAATVANGTLDASGIIETQGDTDILRFTTGSTGTLSLTALPYVDVALTPTHTGNLDIQLELLSSTGTVLALNSPLDSPRASLTTVISPGTYYLRITPSSTGAPFNNPSTGYTLYGSRGQYFISGTIPTGVVFATFLNQYFTAGEQLDALVSGPAADPDRDGLNNLVEYATGRDPRQPDAAASTTAGLSSSYLTLTYDRRLDTSDVTYTVQASDDLLTWSTPASIEQVSVTALSATVERVTVRNAVSTGPRRFLRLQVATP